MTNPTNLRALCAHHAARMTTDDVLQWRLDCPPGAVIELLDEVERLRSSEVKNLETWREAHRQAAELAAANAEVERLRDAESARIAPFKPGETIVTTAASTLDHFINQRDEARAALKKEQLDHISKLGEMSEQLADMTAARDEACEIAEDLRDAVDHADAWGHVVRPHSNYKTRIAALKAVGK